MSRFKPLRHRNFRKREVFVTRSMTPMGLRFSMAATLKYDLAKYTYAELQYDEEGDIMRIIFKEQRSYKSDSELQFCKGCPYIAVTSFENFFNIEIEKRRHRITEIEAGIIDINFNESYREDFTGEGHEK